MKEAGTPSIVSREEWERARAELLVREKEHTQASDALAAARATQTGTRLDLGRRKPGRGYGDANRDAARFNIPTDSGGDPAGPGACLDRLLT
jgi:Bacterial protein of unknown function (DUF899)